MDLDFECLDHYDYTIVHPKTYKKTDGVIRLVSPFTDRYQSTLREYMSQVAKGMEPNEATAILASKCIIKWENVIVGGEELEFTEENALNLLMKQPWLTSQLDVVLSNSGNFIKG